MRQSINVTSSSGMNGGAALRALALVGALAVLAGCSEYLDRRDTIALSGGDALASNQVTHMVDPWPRVSGDRDIAFNGERAARAVARYRAGKVIRPRGTGTSSGYGQADPGSNPANPPPVGPVAAPPK
jgi:hypothetical protein